MDNKQTVHALLIVDDKNRLEQLRLRYFLKDLELQKDRRRKEHFNEIFQQKRLVYGMKKELTDTIKLPARQNNKPKKSKLLMKYKNLKIGRLAVSEGNATYTEVTDDSGNHHVDSAHGGDQIARGNYTRSISTLPMIVEERDRAVSKSETGRDNSTMRRRPAFIEMNAMPDIRTGTFKSPKQVILSVNNLKHFNDIKDAEVDTKMPHEDTKEDVTRVTRTLPGSVEDMNKFPNVLVKMLGEVEDDGIVADIDEAAMTLAARDSKDFDMLTCSFDLRNIALKAKEDQQDVIKTNKTRRRLMREESYWVGDPIAVGSVRRGRSSLHAQTNRTNRIVMIRRVLSNVDPPHRCSRNCNRPGSEFSVLDFPESVPFYEHRAQLNKNRKLTKKILTAYDEYNNKEMGFDEKGLDELKNKNESLAAILVKYDDLVREQIRYKRARKSSLSSTAQNLQKEFEEVKGKQPAVLADAVIQDANNEMRVVVGLEYKPLQRVGDRKPSLIDNELTMPDASTQVSV